MRPEQQISPQQLMNQERSFSEVCVPELMSLAANNKHSVAAMVRHLPQQWQFSDRLLVSVFPTFREDVEAFYAGKGKSMTEMFSPDQLVSIDSGARLTLLLKLTGAV